MPGHDVARLRRTLLLGGYAVIAGPAVRAESGPPLRLIVPFPPGGSSDILARAIGTPLGLALGRTIVIDNRPGAGGSIGATEAARAAPDGGTLLMGHTGALAVSPAIYPRLAYDPIKSFVPVAWVARVPNVLVVNSNSPVTTLAALVSRANAQPNRMTYSSGGNGSAAHISFEYLKLAAHFQMLHIPYRGTAPSITDLLAGQVDATFTGVPAVLPHLRSGRLRALAVSSPSRLPTLPEVPTVAERGYPGFDADQWYGIVAPAGTNAALVARLNLEIDKALQMPAVAAQLVAEGAWPMPGTPAAFGALIAREVPRWAQVVRAANVKLE